MDIQAILGFSIGALSIGNILSAVVQLVLCLIIIKFIMGMVEKMLSEKSHVPVTLHAIIRSGLKVILYFVTVLIVAGGLGIETSSLLAVFSLAGVAFSLALQGSLSNLASGVLLLITRPFKVGDFIDASGVSGTVKEIGLIYTRLGTPANQDIFVPNSEISANKVINYSTETTRRADIVVSAAYESPVEDVKSALFQAIGNTENILTDPAPFVRLSAYKDSCIEYTVRVWANSADYWNVYFDLLENISTSFQRNGVEMTYNHLNVHMIEDKK